MCYLKAANPPGKQGQSQFRNWITPDGSAGPTGEGGFKAEAGRYHLYVSLACPWAHRTLIFRKLKKLGRHDQCRCRLALHGRYDGWTFDADQGRPGDRLYGSDFLRDIYLKARPNYSGRVTVPILWDKKRETIVSNESSEIIRMFNSAFDGLTGDDTGRFLPARAARRDRCDQRTRLSERQQRRLPRRLRDHAGRL
jgi:putative glutathione S-transferase